MHALVVCTFFFITKPVLQTTDCYHSFVHSYLLFFLLFLDYGRHFLFVCRPDVSLFWCRRHRVASTRCSHSDFFSLSLSFLHTLITLRVFVLALKIERFSVSNSSTETTNAVHGRCESVFGLRNSLPPFHRRPEKETNKWRTTAPTKFNKNLIFLSSRPKNVRLFFSQCSA